MPKRKGRMGQPQRTVRGFFEGIDMRINQSVKEGRQGRKKKDEKAGRGNKRGRKCTFQTDTRNRKKEGGPCGHSRRGKFTLVRGTKMGKRGKKHIGQAIWTRNLGGDIGVGAFDGEGGLEREATSKQK